MRNYALSRRALLKGAGAVALGQFAAPAIFAQQAKLVGDFDAVIVGSGPAGLSAARTLIAAGKKIVVLEADDRKGGRANTDTTTFPGVAFDRGCAWIHSADRNPLFPFAKANGFTLQSRRQS